MVAEAVPTVPCGSKMTQFSPYPAAPVVGKAVTWAQVAPELVLTLKPLEREPK
jgi:hypothetical protein